MPRVVHFEINSDDPKKAVEFYRKVFGWTAVKWEGPFDYWLVTTGEDEEPGINGAIMVKGNNQGFINTLDVPSVDEFIKKTEEAGGKVVQPKTPVPGVGYMAYCADLDGNVFGIMQTDESAA